MPDSEIQSGMIKICLYNQVENSEPKMLWMEKFKLKRSSLMEMLNMNKTKETPRVQFPLFKHAQFLKEKEDLRTFFFMC